jgi:hypothetical protein
MCTATITNAVPMISPRAFSSTSTWPPEHRVLMRLEQVAAGLEQPRPFGLRQDARRRHTEPSCSTVTRGV